MVSEESTMPWMIAIFRSRGSETESIGSWEAPEAEVPEAEVAEAEVAEAEVPEAEDPEAEVEEDGLGTDCTVDVIDDLECENNR